MYKAVYRQIGGCEVPIIVRYDVGRPLAAPLLEPPELNRSAAPMSSGALAMCPAGGG